MIRVERDATQPGDELLLGFGKTARDGLHRPKAVASTCDFVITNVVVARPDPRRPQGRDRHPRGPDRARSAGPATPTPSTAIDVVVGTGTAVDLAARA